MVHVFKGEAVLRKPFPLLCRDCAANAAPECVNAAMEVLNAPAEVLNTSLEDTNVAHEKP